MRVAYNLSNIIMGESKYALYSFSVYQYFVSLDFSIKVFNDITFLAYLNV